MTSVRRNVPRTFFLLCAVAAALLLVAPAAFARAPSIDWQACEDAEGFECATVEVPRNYGNPDGPTVDLARSAHPRRRTSAASRAQRA